MRKTKQFSGKQKSPTGKKRKEKASPQPLFASILDGNIPSELNEETIRTLRAAMKAWTTYVDRLSSVHSMDTETKFLVARALLRRGVANTLLCEWHTAVSDFSQVITLDANEAETNTAYMYRAQANDALAYYEESMRDWTWVLMAIEHASSQPERFSKELASQGYAFRARLYCRQERYTQAISDCDRALALDKECAEAYSVRGRAFSLLNKLTPALADCTKAIELAGWPVHYYRRGLVHKQMGNYEQGFVDFEQAYHQEPDNALFKREHADLFLLRLIQSGIVDVPSQETAPPV